MVEQSSTIRDLLALVRGVVNDKPVAWHTITVDDALVRMARRHKLDALIAYAVLPEKGDGSAACEALRRSQTLEAARDLWQRSEAEALFSCLEHKHIDYLPLKGLLLKQLYPCPGMRTMCDIDVLIRPADAAAVGEFLLARGYETAFTNVEQDAYRKMPFGNIEIHKQLIGTQHRQYHAYYADIWQRAHREAPDSCRYVLSSADFYIYQLLHLAKHYKVGGTGIRSILDIYLYLRGHAELAHSSYLCGELERLGLVAFDENIRALADAWFGTGKMNPTLEEMQHYIVASGMYGTRQNWRISDQLKRDQSRLAYYWHALFPDLTTMSTLYPVLNRRPYLIGWFWLYKMVTRAVLRPVRLCRRLAARVPVSTDEAESRRAHLARVGLL